MKGVFFNTKKGFLLIGSIFLSLFLGIILSLSLLRSYMHIRLIENQRASLNAFFCAESGIENALFELRRDQNWRTGFNNQPLYDKNGNVIGYYTVQVATGSYYSYWPTVWIQSTGTDLQGKVRRIIRARVAVQSPAAFFTFTLGDLTVGSGANITGEILGRDVKFEVNTNLPEDERWINVNGDVMYLRSIEGEDDPYVNITGNISKTHPITFTSIDLQRYRALAQQNGRYIGGDFTYSGDIDRTSLNAPNGVIFAEGDVHISGTVKESILIVSAKNIYIDNSIVYSSTGTNPQIGLFSAGDVLISSSAPSDLEINGLVIADGGVVKALGEKASKGTLTFNGAISVRGKEGQRSVVDLNVYSHRHYNYDSSLYSASTIPFMTYIANLIEWEEITPQEALNFPPSS